MSPDPNFNIVLVEPEIPNNTGSIGRTCVGMGCRLHLVEPLGFDISDRAVKRAGLDYWPSLDLKTYRSWDHFKDQPLDESRVFYFSKFAGKYVYDQKFEKGDWFVFGKETKGLGSEFLKKLPQENILALPIWGPIRSLNLSNAVAVVMYEAARQVLMKTLTPNNYHIE